MLLNMGFLVLNSTLKSPKHLRLKVVPESLVGCSEAGGGTNRHHKQPVCLRQIWEFADLQLQGGATTALLL